MKAILVDQETKLLSIGEAEEPKLGEYEVLIENKATSLNRMDLLQKWGRYPVPKDASPILGVDCSGTVIKVGPKVSRFKIGDEVFGLLQGGGYAQNCVNHEDLLWLKPSNLNFEEASSIPEVFLTAYQALFTIGSLTSNQKALIHAGASGVGSAAIQLCKIKGIPSYFTASSKEKIDFGLSLGAKKGINYKTEDFSKLIDDSVNVILDFVGKDYFEKNLSVLAQGGHLIIISFLSGPKVEKFDLSLILRKWIKIEGTTLRARDHNYRAKLMKECGRILLPALQNNKIKPTLYRTLSWKEANQAHEIMEKNENLGKIVLRID